jgi:hypothetical protein
MTRFLRRFTLLLVPFVVAVTQALPGRAQQPLSSRYAFADTLLLRDTLGLKFDGIFPAADSLGIPPDTLRALMIRYRFPLQRLLFLSDSMVVPVDSVGVVVDRERFNPLARGQAGIRRTENTFRYTSGWSTTRTTSAWSNNSEFRWLRGSYYANNRTDVNLEQYESAASTTLRQTRDMTTEAGTRLSNRHSVGVTAHTMLYDSYDPGSTSNQQETLNEVKLTARTQQRGPRGSSSELTLLGGVLDDDKRNVEIKRGLTGRADGRVRSVYDTWLTNDLTGAVSSNLARTRRPEQIDELRALDFATNLNGTLTLFAQRRVGFNLNYTLRRTRVDTPTDSGTVSTIHQAGDGVTGTLRLRQDNDRTLTLVGGTNSSLTQTGQRRDYNAKATGRWLLAGWATDASYMSGSSNSDYPRRNNAYGYNERSTTHSADGQMQRPLGRRLQAKLSGNINLTQARYEATSTSATPPSPRDTYRQSYRAEARYNPTARLSTGVALEVTLARTINIEPLNTASNTDTRSYRGEWIWSYQLLQGLTVSQNNRISSDYLFYPFSPERNTLGLSYNTTTTLNTVLTPRLTLAVMHTAQQAPRGSYTVQSDGLEYLKLSDEAESYALHASIRYAPTPVVSFSLEPDYRADTRSGTTDGVSAKQRDDRRLDISGRVDLNVQVGRRGTLAGGIARTFNDSRSTTFTNSVGTLSPRSLTDYWNGSLTFTWQL